MAHVQLQLGISACNHYRLYVMVVALLAAIDPFSHRIAYQGTHLELISACSYRHVEPRQV